MTTPEQPELDIPTVLRSNFRFALPEVDSGINQQQSVSAGVRPEYFPNTAEAAFGHLSLHNIGVAVAKAYTGKTDLVRDIGQRFAARGMAVLSEDAYAEVNMSPNGLALLNKRTKAFGDKHGPDGVVLIDNAGFLAVHGDNADMNEAREEVLYTLFNFAESRRNSPAVFMTTRGAPSSNPEYPSLLEIVDSMDKEAEQREPHVIEFKEVISDDGAAHMILSGLAKVTSVSLSKLVSAQQAEAAINFFKESDKLSYEIVKQLVRRKQDNPDVSILAAAQDLIAEREAEAEARPTQSQPATKVQRAQALLRREVSAYPMLLALHD